MGAYQPESSEGGFAPTGAIGDVLLECPKAGHQGTDGVERRLKRLAF
jgi:hypothetical protein